MPPLPALTERIVSPKISIIIPNRNNAARLEQCLQAVLRECDGREDVEVIVVDNGSTDGSLKTVRQYPVQALKDNSLASPFLPRNIGIEAACGEIFILLDSNCIPQPGWLNFGILALKGKEIVTASIVFDAIPNGDSIAKFDAAYSWIDINEGSLISALPTTNLFTKRNVFQQHGLFIPELRGLGDIEWTQRVHRGGGKLGVATSALVRYPAKSGWAFAQKMFRLGRGHKEWAVYERGTWLSVRYGLRAIRQFLPPSPRFVQRMYRRGQLLDLPISWLGVFLLCYFTKVLRGGGMLFGKVHPHLYQHPGPEKL